MADNQTEIASAWLCTESSPVANCSQSLQGTSPFSPFSGSSLAPESEDGSMPVGVWIGIGVFFSVVIVAIVVTVLYPQYCETFCTEYNYDEESCRGCHRRLANRVTNNFIINRIRSLISQPTTARPVNMIYTPGRSPGGSPSAQQFSRMYRHMFKVHMENQGLTWDDMSELESPAYPPPMETEPCLPSVEECPMHPNDACGCLTQQSRSELLAIVEEEELNRALVESKEQYEQSRHQEPSLNLTPLGGAGPESSSDQERNVTGSASALDVTDHTSAQPGKGAGSRLSSLQGRSPPADSANSPETSLTAPPSSVQAPHSDSDCSSEEDFYSCPGSPSKSDSPLSLKEKFQHCTRRLQ